MFEVGCAFGNGDDQPVDALIHDALHDMFFPVLTVMRLAEQDGIFVCGGGVLYRADGGGEIELGQIGQDDPNGKGSFLLKEDGFLIGLVVQFPGQFLHPYPREDIDALVVMERPGHGRGRNV